MKFNYGDSVFFLKKDEKGDIISKIYASVIWITLIESDEDSKFFNGPIGATLYNIEFNDGSFQEFVSEDLLEKYS